MVDNIVIKPLGLVLIVTAHMVFSGHSKAEVTTIIGILGSSITLNFTFSDPRVLDDRSYVAVYLEREKKIAECKSRSGCKVVGIDPTNNVVFYHISNLKQNDSNRYWAALMEPAVPIKSNKVQLDVREENRSSTVPPKPTNTTPIVSSGSSSFFSLDIVTVLVVSPVVLLAAILPCLIWCLVRTKGKQPQSQQNSNPTLQETIETNSISPPSVIYSVLDFPKRPSTVLEIHLNDTEYAAVSYLSEKRITQG